MTRGDAHTDAMLRHLGAAYYESLHGRASAADVARARAAIEERLAEQRTLVITGGENGGPWLGGTGRNLRAYLLSPFVSQKLTAFISQQRHADLMTLRP